MKFRQRVSYYILLLWFCSSAQIACAQVHPLPTTMEQGWQLLLSDYRDFYLSKDQWIRLGAGFTVAGVMANTNTDQYIRDWYQDHERGAVSDDVSKFVKNFGRWQTMLPVSLAAVGIGYLLPQDSESPIGIWGEQTLRAYVTAAPLMYAGQWLTGGSRPGEKENASHWRPLVDVNGISGHAFVGAVPFMTIAHMSTNPFIHYGAYAASALTAWSRVNDDAHFTSQALLGWFIAYETTNSVFADEGHINLDHIALLPLPNGATLQVNYQW